MAFNNGYPISYPQYFPQNNYTQQQMMSPQMMNTQQSVPQIQNSGFISVPNEEVARNYPVAHGNSVTFKDENAPYIYTKTMGFSQLDRPVFDKYKLIREEEESPVIDEIPKNNEELDKIKSDIQSIWSEINVLKEQGKKPTNNRRKDDGGDRHDE